MVLKVLLVIMMVLRQGVHKVVVLCPVHVSVGRGTVLMVFYV